MKITESWLKTHLETSLDAETLGKKLTDLGLELERLVVQGQDLKDFVVASIVSHERHPNAERLNVCQVQAVEGGPLLQVICGGTNVKSPMKVVLAKPGTQIPGSGITIKSSAIRGAQSDGMLCSVEELGLDMPREPGHILELPGDAPIGQSLADYFGGADAVFELSVTPNRGDALGVRGIARDLAAAGAGTLKPGPNPKVETSFNSDVTVTINDLDKCPYFAGRVIRGVRNGPSPAWLQARLQSVGMKSISALVDITNFVLMDINRPLHVYDLAKLKGNLVVRSAREGESFQALDDNTYTLKEEFLVVADEAGPVSLAGVMGGSASAVQFETVDVFLECAYFVPSVTRTSGRALNINSESRFRSDRGIDPASPLLGLEYATQLILEICGGEAGSVVAAGGPPKDAPEITFSLEAFQRRTGVSLPLSVIAKYLEAVGLSVVAEDKESLQLIPPTWRHDLRIPEDLMEEVLRLYGYDEIPATPLPMTAPKRVLTLLQQRAFLVRQALAMRGLNEVVTWAMVSEKQSALVEGVRPELKIRNPITEELAFLRTSLLPTLLDVVKRGVERGGDALNLFEVGNTYQGLQPEDHQLTAAGLRFGFVSELGWKAPQVEADIYDVKADVAGIAEVFQLPFEKIQLSTQDLPTWYHPGRGAVLKLGPRILGYFGELHPAIVAFYGLKKRPVAFEVFLKHFPEMPYKGPYKKAPLLSPYQQVKRDFAFVMAADTAVGPLVEATQKIDPQLIRSVVIFDIFQGKGVTEGQKSVSLRVTLVPADRTLSEEEIKTLCDKIIAVANTTGAQLRI